ncbi:hypothetical protein F4810DRAFT_693559 [Camillea tinctor]|nr:hypothetical protein F4810DRAFT_693559 [Camillea tinctor]
MAPIDYSKWDNITTDSDSEPETAVPIPAPPSANPPPPSSIPAVVIRCEGERLTNLPWCAATVSATHTVFSQPAAPVPTLVGVPLVLHRVGTRAATRSALDNQMATYLSIDAESGFAPAAWQAYVGTVVVARKDRKPLLPHHVEGLWMYCDYILDLFGEGEGPPRHLYNRQAFEKWWKKYCQRQNEIRNGTGGESDLDDWRNVKSPYEV